MKIICTLIALCSYCLLHAQKAGTLDSSFGNSGKVLTSSSTGYLDCTAAALTSNGSIVASGDVSFVGETGGFFAMKYFADGELDTTFGNKGIGIVTNAGYGDAVAVQSDDKIIIAGYDYELFGPYFITAARLNADGSVDTTFGKNGLIKTSAGEDCNSIAIQSDGKIVVGRSKR